MIAAKQQKVWHTSCSCMNKDFPCTDACRSSAYDCENSEYTGQYKQAEYRQYASREDD